jgi:hypothetical protein
MTKHMGRGGLQIGNGVQRRQRVNGGWCLGDTCRIRMF